MKDVTKDLATYLNEQKNMISCDLYELTLASGIVYYVADYDKDVYWNQNYQHNLFLISREQTKIQGEVSVDTLTVNIYCNSDDKIESTSLLQYAHNGGLDQATLTLKRAFFDGDNCIGVINLFSGVVEISSAGGLNLKLTAKAKTTGLAGKYPIRNYFPQGSYSTVNGNVVSSSTDEYSCMIPLKPSQRVLI